MKNLLSTKLITGSALCLVCGIFNTSAVIAAPEVISEKVVKQEDRGDANSETILTHYKGGWRVYSELVEFNDKKLGVMIFVHIYSPGKKLACSYVYGQSPGGMSDIEKTTLLAQCFKKITSKKYKIEDFVVIKGDNDGKTQEIMQWIHKLDEEELVYAYKRESSVAAFTKQYLEATLTNLVPMVGHAPVK